MEYSEDKKKLPGRKVWELTFAPINLEIKAAKFSFRNFGAEFPLRGKP